MRALPCNRASRSFNPRSGPRAGAMRGRWCGIGDHVSIRAPFEGRSDGDAQGSSPKTFQSALRSEGRSDLRPIAVRQASAPACFNPRSGPRAGAMAHRFAADMPATYLGDFANVVKEPKSGAVNGFGIRPWQWNQEGDAMPCERVRRKPRQMIRNRCVSSLKRSAHLFPDRAVCPRHDARCGRDRPGR